MPAAWRWRWLWLALWLWPLSVPLFDGVDSLGYMAPAWSAVDDGDLSYLDEYERGGMPEALARPTATGLMGNHWNVGLGLLFMPTYALVRAAGASEGPSAAALTAAHAFGLAFAALFACTVHAIARRIAAASDAARPGTAAVIVTVALYVGTPIVFYVHASSLRPHVHEAALAGVLVLAWLRYRERSSSVLALVMGAALALAMLVRSQSAPLVLLPIGEAVRRAWTGRYDDRPRTAFVLDAALLVAPLVYAVWLARCYDAVLWGPGGGAVPGSFMATEWSLGHALTHPHHGLFAWSPVLVLPTVGLVVLARRDPWLAIACGGVLLVQLALNGTSYDHVIDAPKYSRHWSGGASFGARRWCCVLPLFAIGGGALAGAIRGTGVRGIVLAFTVVACLFSLDLALLGRLQPASVIAAPMDAPRLARIAGEGVVSLPGRIAGWLALVPPWDVAAHAWLAVAVQTAVIVIAWAVLRARSPRVQLTSLGLAVTIAAIAEAILALHLAATSSAAAAREAATMAAIARAQAPRRNHVQYDVWIRQARLRRATDEPDAALRTYERAFALGYGRDTLIEYTTLLLEHEGRDQTIARLRALRERHGDHPFLAEAITAAETSASTTEPSRP